MDRRTFLQALGGIAVAPSALKALEQIQQPSGTPVWCSYSGTPDSFTTVRAGYSPFSVGDTVVIGDEVFRVVAINNGVLTLDDRTVFSKRAPSKRDLRLSPAAERKRAKTHTHAMKPRALPAPKLLHCFSEVRPS